jgi:predicted metal-binding protein
MAKRKRKVGIIICDRYSACAGGKCLRSLRNKEGAFNIYSEVELVGYTTCGGCPGGNIEYCIDEMKRNGAEAVHLATGMVVGYPPCPYIDHFRSLIKKKHGLEVIVGTHPIPCNYRETHAALGTWNSPEWKEKLKYILTDEKTQRKYS